MINPHITLTPITHRKLPLLGHFYVYPYAIYATSSHILLYDYIDQINNLHAICRKTGKHIHSFACIGSGDKEIKQSTAPCLTNSGKLLMMDMDTHRALEFNIDSLESPLFEHIAQYRFSSVHSNPLAFHAADKGFLIMYANDDIRFGCCDGDSVNICYCNYPRLSANDDVCRQLWSFGVRTALSGDAKRLAIGTYIGASLEIFDISNLNDIQSIAMNSLFPSNCDFDPHTKMISPNDDTIYGFLDLASSSTHIFAIIEGKCHEQWSNADPTPKPHHHGSRHITIFDLNGTQVSTLELDRCIFRLTLDERSNVIFALARSEDGLIELLEIQFDFTKL